MGRRLRVLSRFTIVAGMGAGFTYLLDPQLGEPRRRHLGALLARRLGTTPRSGSSNAVDDVASRIDAAMSPPPSTASADPDAADPVLALDLRQGNERARSDAPLAVRHQRFDSLEVLIDDVGVIEIRGPLGEVERVQLLAAASQFEGVRAVRDHSHRVLTDEVRADRRT